MRNLILGLAALVALSGPTALTASANSNEDAAQQIASNLKQSGKLKDYRVGVKYEDGVAWLMGTVTSEQQKRVAEQIARDSAGVDHIISKLTVEGGSAQPKAATDRAGSAMQNQNAIVQTKASGTVSGHLNAAGESRARSEQRNNMPMPYAPSGHGVHPAQHGPSGPGVQPANYNQQAHYHHAGGPMHHTGGHPMHPGHMHGPGMGGPVPMSHVPVAAGQTVSHEDPKLPPYVWPTYAASPNYAALTYPKQYSASAWPYIGPFYPYPQVPLGWRKVTLEWDDGWWFLDFKDGKHCR